MCSLEYLSYFSFFDNYKLEANVSEFLAVKNPRVSSLCESRFQQSINNTGIFYDRSNYSRAACGMVGSTYARSNCSQKVECLPGHTVRN